MKQLSVLFVALCCTILAYAQVNIDGLYYNLDNTQLTAEVTYPAEGETYSGNIVIPASVTHDAKTYTVTAIYGAFEYLDALLTVSIPATVTSISDYDFEWCQALTAINVAADNANYSSADGVLFNKDKTILMDYPCGKTGAYSIPSVTTTLSDEAFCGSTGLTSVSIPASLTTMGWGNFTYCTALMAINVAAENSVYSSLDGVLFSKDKTSLLVYPGGKTGAYSIPNGTTSIGNNAFCGNSGLTTISFPASIKKIADWAFSGSEALTSVVVPEWIDSIGEGAFDQCKALASLTLNNGVRFIGELAFSECSVLPEINVPASVDSIGHSAFRFGDEMTAINVDESNTKYCSVDGVLFNKDKTRLIQYPCGKAGAYSIPATTIRMDGSAFWQAYKLTAVVIPNSVIEIPRYAFNDCTAMTSIIIGSGVTHIGERGLYNCTGLESITCYAVTPPTMDYAAIWNVDTNIPLYVPAESVAAYSNALYWRDFHNIHAIVPTAFDGVQPTCVDTARKLLRNGQIIILHEGKHYNLLGTQLK